MPPVEKVNFELNKLCTLQQYCNANNRTMVEMRSYYAYLHEQFTLVLLSIVSVGICEKRVKETVE